jgi:hypothetical protein
MEVTRDNNILVRLDEFVKQDKERDILLRVRMFLIWHFSYQTDFKSLPNMFKIFLTLLYVTLTKRCVTEPD